MEAIAEKEAMKRTTLSIPDDLYADLEAQAESELRTIQNLLVWAGQKYIDECKANGSFPEREDSADSEPSEETEAVILAAQSKDRLIQSLLEGSDRTKNGDLIIAADSLGVDRETLEQLVRRLCNGDSKNAGSKR